MAADSEYSSSAQSPAAARPSLSQSHTGPHTWSHGPHTPRPRRHSLGASHAPRAVPLHQPCSQGHVRLVTCLTSSGLCFHLSSSLMRRAPRGWATLTSLLCDLPSYHLYVLIFSPARAPRRVSLFSGVIICLLPLEYKLFQGRVFILFTNTSRTPTVLCKYCLKEWTRNIFKDTAQCLVPCRHSRIMATTRCPKKTEPRRAQGGCSSAAGPPAVGLPRVCSGTRQLPRVQHTQLASWGSASPVCRGTRLASSSPNSKDNLSTHLQLQKRLQPRAALTSQVLKHWLVRA